MHEGDKSEMLRKRIQAELRRDADSYRREQTAVTILAALLRNEAGSRRNDDEVCADAVALTDELRAKLAVKP